MRRGRTTLAVLLTALGLAAPGRGADWIPGPAKPSLMQSVDPTFREAVARVLSKPTISASGSNGEVACSVEHYCWLLDHPDRVSLAWKRLRVPCVDITELGQGKFVWIDENGSEISWQTVGRTGDGLIWYATGKVKPTAVLPTVPVKAVAVVSRREGTNAKGEKVLHPVAHVYLHTESRAANLILRMIGPTAPKLAEQGAEQLLFFFNGVGNHIARNPEQTEMLLAPAKK